MAGEMEVFVKLLSLAKSLRGFGVEDLRNLLTVTTKQTWKAGEEIFSEGEAGRDMFIICSGKVDVWRKGNGRKISLAILVQGDSFGEMGFLRGGPRSASSTALEQTIALRINHEKLHSVPSISALLYRNLAKELADRLMTANDTIVYESKSSYTGVH